MMQDSGKKEPELQTVPRGEADRGAHIGKSHRACPIISSAHNMQPLKYVLSHTRERNQSIFSTLRWAVYLKDRPGPAEGEHPAGYVVILGDREISESVPWDYPIAAQTIALGAAEIGLGACILASIDKSVSLKQ